ncbi:hypothetical protein BH11CYA1_BH11CYA1_15470 [soil metagenome]
MTATTVNNTHNNNTNNNSISVDISAIERKLSPVFERLYSSMLGKARIDDTYLAKLREYLKKFNLLSVREKSVFKPKEIAFDQGQLGDASYRRRLIRQLKAPRPSAYVYHTLPVDAERLAMQPYFEALTEFLVRATCERMVEAKGEQLAIIAGMNEDALFDFLKQRSLYEMTADNLSDHALRHMCERLIDNCPSFQVACALIREAGQAARDHFNSEMAIFNAAAQLDFNARMDAISARAAAGCDSYISELQQRAEERDALKRAEDAVKAEEDARNFGKSEQQLFFEAVKRRELEHRKNNPMHPLLKAIFWGGAIALTVAFACFGEVDGVTLPELLGLID